MSAATPAPIWWCDVGGGVSPDTFNGTAAQCAQGLLMKDKGHLNCRERRLVDPLALVVERDATGEWPGPIDDAPPVADIQEALNWWDSHAWPMGVGSRVSLGALYYAAKAYVHIFTESVARREAST